MTVYRQTPLRASAKFIAHMKAIARYYGRTLGEELKLAADLHAHEATLAMLRSPDAQDDPELQERLAADPNFERQVEGNLQALRDRAFIRQVPPADLIDDYEFNDAA